MGHKPAVVQVLRGLCRTKPTPRESGALARKIIGKYSGAPQPGIQQLSQLTPWHGPRPCNLLSRSENLPRTTQREPRPEPAATASDSSEFAADPDTMGRWAKHSF